MPTGRTTVVVVAALIAGMALTGVSHAAGPAVLRVGTFNALAGDYTSIQAAVDAAQPGDWVLVAPGDYKEAVRITTPGIHLRGLDRNNVVVDGTRPGTAPCSAAKADQGPGGNGVEVFETDGVEVSNLTVCNFLAGNGGDGNEIWFNGGDGSGRVALGRFRGRYLSATTTYAPVDGKGPMAMYGLFASNASGPGDFTHTYASNMADSAYYVGACPDCNTTIKDGHGVNSALGYSGTNAGGNLEIVDSEFDLNTSGIVPNTLNNDDAPSPQDGACPGNPKRSCTKIHHNNVHDNNNPNVPASGVAGTAPVGTGIEISGGRNDHVYDNDVYNQGAFGIVLHDYPDTETAPPISHCEGGIAVAAADVCYYQATGIEVDHNWLVHNGYFRNPGNGDLANATTSALPGNCFHDNVDPAGLTSDPPAIEKVDGMCDGIAPGGGALAVLGLVCASGVLGSAVPGLQCPATPITNYPRRTGTILVPLPMEPTMPDPCADVPANAWCP